MEKMEQRAVGPRGIFVPSYKTCALTALSGSSRSRKAREGCSGELQGVDEVSAYHDAGGTVSELVIDYADLISDWLSWGCIANVDVRGSVVWLAGMD
ncbi:hypothetical protein EYC84_002761 [Monilinia fructicola]|uniref:Uncharacterized protein n=1 Tax=Monilinia fructicola TaxID=38448 RepID=A0A5M9JPB4_MONFR|nr:hypothetical protein EYC84_002761 [Monilinia fructicola]